MSGRGWIGVDLDATLAEYHGWVDAAHIGPPVPAMVQRVKAWLGRGIEVRIFTARVYSDGSAAREGDVRIARAAIEAWCGKHIGHVLPITCTKDFGMVSLYDDRAVQIEANTGRRVDGGE